MAETTINVDFRCPNCGRTNTFEVVTSASYLGEGMFHIVFPEGVTPQIVVERCGCAALDDGDAGAGGVE